MLLGRDGGAGVEFSVLSSGSRANAIYVASGGTSLLIDCGLSGRELDRRLGRLSLAASSLSAVVVSHEHSDHVVGIPQLMKRAAVPVFATEGSWAASRELETVPEELRRRCRAGEPFIVGELTVEPFSVIHDAMDPVMFRVSDGASVLCIVTDLGQSTTLVRERIRGATAIVLEANHDPDMLFAAPYPWSVKQRIRSRHGHLSNEEAGELLLELRAGSLSDPKVIVAAHISEKSNTPERARSTLEHAWHGSRELLELDAIPDGEDRPGPRFIAASAAFETPLIRLV